MTDNNYTVYVHVSPGRKYYVGQTCIPLKWRWGKDGHGYKAQYFSRAIKKYGWDNFKHIIVAEHLTKEDACELEKRLIEVLQSNNPKYGYNISSGGESSTGFHHSDEVKDRIAEASSLPIDQYDLNGNYIKSWKSAQVAARVLKIDGSAILKCCKGKYHSSKGYVWRYKGEPYEKYLRKKYQHPTFMKSVDQYTKDGEYITTWSSLQDAAAAMGANHSSCISACCKGRKNSAYGFVWRYSGNV